MQLSEMVKNVQANTGPEVGYNAIIKRFLNEAQRILFDQKTGGKWNCLIRNDLEITTSTNTAEYALDPYVNSIIGVRDELNNLYLDYVENNRLNRSEPNLSTQGTSVLYTLKGTSPVKNQPSAASVITFVSDNAGDDAVGTGVSIFIQGLNSDNVIITESVALDGVNNVSTTKSYVKILKLSKTNYTNGIVTVTSNAGAVTNVVWGPNNRDITHPVVYFYSRPSAALTIKYDAYMKPLDMVNDNDSSIFPLEFHDALEKYATFRVFLVQKDNTAAQLMKQLYDSRVMDLIKNDIGQSQISTIDKDCSINAYSHSYPMIRPQGNWSF